MSVGLYDLDLWHGLRPCPNLELMKIFNYFYQKNEQVMMMTPKTEEGRFNKIIYFKNNFETRIPPKIELSSQNKQIYGFGFYGKLDPLPEKIKNTPPSFLPYDCFSERIHCKGGYETLRKNSLIRLETEDFTGFHKNSKIIYLVDQKPLYLTGLIDFLKSHKQYRFNFFYPLTVIDEKTCKTIEPYAHLLERRLFIDFKFDKDFFITHLNEHIAFNERKYPEESFNSYYLRLTKMGLVRKHLQKEYAYIKNTASDDFARSIVSWLRDSSPISYVDFYKNDKILLSRAQSAPAQLRLALKQNPQTYNIKQLDFWEKI